MKRLLLLAMCLTMTGLAFGKRHDTTGCGDQARDKWTEDQGRHRFKNPVLAVLEWLIDENSPSFSIDSNTPFLYNSFVTTDPSFAAIPANAFSRVT
jgi:hypothetical protein